MFYALLTEDGQLDCYPYTLTDLIRANPNTSFALPISDEVAASFGLVPVRPTEPGPEDPLSNRERTAELINGEWVEVWVTTPASPIEVAQRTESQSAAVREDRNRRLADCDWTQLSDAPVDVAAWTAYRQALRDVPEQAGFPWEVVWPIAPGTVLARARNELGQFVADDPATPIDEAWVAAP